MKKKLVLSIILVSIQLLVLLFAQTEIVYKGAIIEFRNSETRIVEYVYDIEENNPYKNEPIQNMKIILVMI